MSVYSDAWNKGFTEAKRDYDFMRDMVKHEIAMERLRNMEAELAKLL